MSQMTWTTAQQAAIDARGQNLLLSAAAGHTRTQRCGLAMIFGAVAFRSTLVIPTLNRSEEHTSEPSHTVVSRMPSSA